MSGAATVTTTPNPARVRTSTGGETLGQLVRRRSALRGEQVYVEAARSAEVLTFGAVERWCMAFGEAALTPGSTVALSISDPLQCAAALIGAVASGLWVAPLDPATPATGPSGLASLLARVGADVVLSDRPAPRALPGRWVDLASLAPGAGPRSATGGPGAPLAASGGIVLSSSGTTGPPKVIRLRQDKLLHTARCVVAHHQLTERDRGFNPLPLFHINAEVVGLLSTLVAGSRLVLDDRFHRTGFWDLMGRRGITWINAVPAIISRLASLRPGEAVPAGIRFVRSASAPLPVATADEFEATTGVPVVETYGMTEAASQITAHPLSVPRRAGSVGLPVGLELRVVRHDKPAADVEECPSGEVGHVEIRGLSVIDEYAGGQHADRFRPDGWLCTGDLGRLDGDGYLYLVARDDDVINRGGEKVFPREIEEVIVGADRSVSAVAVVGRDHAELGQVPVAFVVVHGVAGPADEAQAVCVATRLTDAISRGLVRNRRPVLLQMVASLPTGATGKVRRHALCEPDTKILFTFECS